MALFPARFDTDIKVFGEHGRIFYENNSGVAMMPQTSTAADLTLTAAHRGHLVICDASARAINLTLPASSEDLDRFLFAIKNQRGPQQVTVRATPGNNIDGAADPVPLQPGEFVILCLDHGTTNWGTMKYSIIAVAAFSSESINAPVTIDTSADGKLYDVDVTGGNVAMQLPAIADIPPTFKVGFRVNRADTGNELTVAAASGELINGTPVRTLNIDKLTKWFAPVGGEWAVIYDYDPQAKPTKAEGQVTIRIPGGAIVNHGLGRRPVPVTFMRQTDNIQVCLSVAYQDEAALLVDGNLAETYLYEAG